MPFPAFLGIFLAFSATAVTLPVASAEFTRFFWVSEGDAPPRLVPEKQLSDSAETNKPAFAAFSSEKWLSSLVSVFQVERPGRTELRRLPPKGQENFIEPLFFALPLEGEPDPLALTGEWEVTATRPYSNPSVFGWEFAVVSNRVAGRFEQSTDYRFAFITSGQMHEHQLELKIDYINDSFLVQGTLGQEVLKGSWKRTDDSEKGEWQATRIKREPSIPLVGTHDLVEWFSGEKRAYLPDHERLPSPWSRGSPLVRVWKITTGP